MNEQATNEIINTVAWLRIRFGVTLSAFSMQYFSSLKNCHDVQIPVLVYGAIFLVSLWTNKLSTSSRFFSSKSHNFGDTQAQALMKHVHQMRSVWSLQFRSISFIVMWLCLNDFEASTLRVTRSDQLFTFLSRCSLCSDFYDIWSHDQIW